MSRNNRNNGNQNCSGSADILALCVFAVNAVGGGAYWKSPHSAGGIAGLAALATVDLALVGAAVYGLYKYCKPKPSEQQQQYEVVLLSGGVTSTTSKRVQPCDVEDGLERMEYPRNYKPFVNQ
ncbi:MAG: hypothetical protein P1U34_12685 [Coxiellaceae bacterium]|nr:hypothetical protein [Coxiellaceae bacterium]